MLYNRTTQAERSKLTIGAHRDASSLDREMNQQGVTEQSLPKVENTPHLSCHFLFTSSLDTSNTFEAFICLNRALPAVVTTFDTSNVCEKEMPRVIAVG